MTSTRLLTIVTFILGSAGLVVISVGDGIPLTVLGAMAVVASAIAFARHFWRENDRKRKQELASYDAAVRAVVAGMPLDELKEDVIAVAKRIDVFTQGVLEYMAQLELDVGDEEKRLLEEISGLGGRIDLVDRRSSKHRNDIVSHLTGIVGVYATLTPSMPYPPFGGWAIAGDCAQRLVGLILSKQPRWIIEAGSGLSTVLAAQALEHLGGDGQVISFEHEVQWLEQSESMVAERGLSHRSQILYTPLVETFIGDENFVWYDLSQVELPENVEIIFIDGPPKATGPLARYPALPMLHEVLGTGGVILLDDAGRPDERAVVERWKKEFGDLHFQYHADSKGSVEIVKAGS